MSNGSANLSSAQRDDARENIACNGAPLKVEKFNYNYEIHSFVGEKEIRRGEFLIKPIVFYSII